MSRILIVDDDQGTRDTFEATLRLAGFDVETASSGRDALDIARTRRSQLVLTDLRLPDISGVDVLRALRAEQVEVPVVILTAFGSVGSAVDALKSGAQDFVEKPIDDADLVDLARRMTVACSNRPPRAATPVADVTIDASSAYSSSVAAARQFIEEHFAEPLTYRVIGAALGRNPEHLERRFRQECGVTLRGYQREVRLRKAYALALAGDKTESLPESVGFKSKSGLLRAFRRLFGRSPGSLKSSSKTRTPEN